VRRLAERHAADVVVVRSPAELYDYCLDRGLGLRESAVEELLADARAAARARRRRRLALLRAAVVLSAPATVGAAAVVLGA
jgi:hypothetical protein